MKNYQEFLKSKIIKTESNGFDIKESDINHSLYDFQKAIVRWAVKKGRACIFADCGLGKTFMQLEWARIMGGTSLILAPLAVSKQTISEGVKIGINVNLCESKEDIIKGINITNYEKLHKFDLTEIDSLILDESSILKSFDGKFRNQIIEQSRNIKYKLACTATPSPNDYMELGNHSEFLGNMTRVEMLATFFLHDGENTSKWVLKGHAKKEFWKWVCSWGCYLRNPEELGFNEKSFELPELKIHKHILKSDIPSDGFLIPMPASSLSERRSARKISLADRVNEVKNHISTGQNLIWCNLNNEGDMLEDTLGAVQVSGSDTDVHKENSMMGFSTGKINTLVTKPKIAGFGMNWQNCNNMIFCGLSDSFEQYYQAIRRCWRFGQKKSVNVYIIISEMEEAILKNIERKQYDHDLMAEEMSRNTKDILNNELHNMKYMEDDYTVDITKEKNFEIYNGDSCEVIKDIASESIGMSLFSPPFSSLYTYSNSTRDMGNCKNNNEFFKHFQFLVSELFRVMMSGRIVAFHCMNLPSSKERDGFIGIKDFRGDLIRIFQNAGFIYHSEVCIWKDPVIAMQRTKALGLLHKQIKKDSCMSRMGIPDYVVAMRKPGDNPLRVTHTNEDFPVDLWQKYASPIWDDINPSDTLQKESAREEDDEKHICPLQLEVIRRCLFLWSKKGDTVLSPFAGIGSEGHEAVKNGRKFIGIELKKSYYDQAVSNLTIAESEMHGELLFR